MFRLAAILLAFQTLAACAAQIDLAVIQFPEPKTAVELAAALQGVSLAEITNSNRTMTGVPSLKGGTVLFAQSIPATPRLESATRLGDTRADVQGTLKNNALHVEIKLSEGVKAGLRRFASRTFSGSASLASGKAQVVSLRTLVSKTQTSVKGNAGVKETVTCNALVAQLR
ncbi:MAG: hypothetical protein ACOVLK_01805 [Terrimicrobiaceae bacterium]|jgi:hypothetical protein